jgi:hypothetical protein
MILGVHKDRDKPHWADFVLATAFESIEAEKCGKCGVPAWHAFSEDPTIEFAMDEHVCHSCTHKEKADEKVKKEKPGVTRFVKAVPVEGFELPTRATFQEQMIAKAIRDAKKAKSGEEIPS